MRRVNKENIVILGYWDGQPMWREKTAEERLQEAGISVETAELYIKLNEQCQKAILTKKE